MTPADLAALHAACFTTPRPWSAAEFADLISNRLVFLLTEPGGFLMGRVIADEAEVLTIAVDPAHRQQGIGARLMRRFLTESASRGATSAFLEVAEGNIPARALYTRAGFAESGRRRGYYHLPDGTPDDALVMTCALAVREA
ncbi:MAG: ribosomal-protein-alanine N-acetyltransferase [Rhodobacteraceae bacterium PARR1]|nr:MAG: ribosomal-protein-alanine N-acetyltransferase [Rhodobacteraceae bacterium PARR1]